MARGNTSAAKTAALVKINRNILKIFLLIGVKILAFNPEEAMDQPASKFFTTRLTRSPAALPWMRGISAFMTLPI